MSPEGQRDNKFILP